MAHAEHCPGSAHSTPNTAHKSPYAPAVDGRATQHHGTEHLAINNTFVRRLLTRLALKTTAKFYKRDCLCFPISRHMIVKTGSRVNLTEAATMQFIAAHTSIPVPRVYCSFVRKGQAYIVMEKIKGESIARAMHQLPPEQFEKTLQQLRRMITELRSLQRPVDCGVQSCVGGSLYDSRIAHCRTRMGPFPTIQAFHLWLRDSFDIGLIDETHEDWQILSEMVSLQEGPWPAPVFTHGDLHPWNILVCDGNISGIIDWEFSGWYPHYWEYTSASYGNMLRPLWEEQLPKFLDPEPTALKMEQTRQRWWGEI